MSVIRRVSVPSGQTVQVVPPDGKPHEGQWQWTVINPTGQPAAVELVDDGAKTVGGGLPLAAGSSWDSMGRDEAVWAAAVGATTEVIVTGTVYGD